MIGSTEQHGPHLPLSTDTLIAKEVGLRVASRLGNALLAPVIQVGVSDHHLAYPGTLSIRKRVMVGLIIDYCGSLAKHGFTNIAILPTHSGNCQPVEESLGHLRREFPKTNFIGFTDLMGYFSPIFRTARKHGVSEEIAGPHAGEWETSVILAIAHELVTMKKARKGFIGNIDQIREMAFTKGAKALSENGVFGDPTVSSAERGARYLSSLTDFFVEYVEERLR
jgi:creatinine amidohydrolase